MSDETKKPIRVFIHPKECKHGYIADCFACKDEDKDKRIAELEAENATLAAGQCIVDHGLIGDQRGNLHCTLQAGQQAAIDGYIEPIAHMYPSDLKRFETKETYATAYSVAVGNPNESSRPLYSEATVQALQAKVRDLEAQNAALSDAEVKRFAAYEESERLQAENAELRAAMEGASRVEAAYGLLWNVMTGDKRINQARRLLLETIDKEGQARGLKAASGFDALRQRADQQDGRESC